MRWAVCLILAVAVSGFACAGEPKSDPQIDRVQSDNVVKLAQICGANLECGFTGSNEEGRKCRDFQKKLNSNPACKKSPKSALGSLSCTGVSEQGGAVLCRTAPNAKVKIARSEKDFYFETADADGRLIVGFDRDEAKTFLEAAGERVNFDLTPRKYDTSRIDGLPPSQVSTFTEAQLKRIRSSSARKKKGFASRAVDMGFKDGFDLPIKAKFTKTTNFGAQRILNGEPKKPHYGVDLAGADWHADLCAG